MQNRIALNNQYNWFSFLLLVATILHLFFDFYLNRIGMHDGSIFPDRNRLRVSLYPVSVLFLEWFLCFAGALFFYLYRQRWAALFLLVGFFMSLTQMFQHQKILFCLVALGLSIQPLQKGDEYSKKFLKIQLILMYVTSAMLKALNLEMFQRSVAQMAGPLNQLTQHSLGLRLGSWLVVALELIIPVLLWFKPVYGFVLLVLFHTALALTAFNVWAFTVLVIAIGTLFLPNRKEI